MEKDQEKLYIQMAREHPDIICSDVPVEILEAAAFSGEEPTNFMKEYLAAGHQEWLIRTLGQRAYFEPEQVDRSVMVLWLRACDLYTSHRFNRPNPEADKPFFSDEGLYD
jgi:hypothetical protein